MTAATAVKRSVLVVVPALNESRTIVQVLGALIGDLAPGRNARVVVADGGSRDGTQDIVRRIAERDPRVVLLENPQRIQSAGINLAVDTYGDQADVLVRCDAHATYPANFVERLLCSLEVHEADAVVVPMDSQGRTCFQRAVAWVSNTWAGTGGSAHRGGRRSGWVDHGHHAAFRMASFRRAGGYDVTYTHNEDAELDCRQRHLGGRIWLDAEIRLAYHPRSTVAALARQYFAYGRGRSRTVRRHPGSIRARQAALPLLISSCALALVLAPWLPVLLALPALYLAMLALTSATTAFSHRSACGLLAGVAAGVMHGAWTAGFVTGLLLLREPAWKPAHASPSHAPGTPRPAEPIRALLVDPSLFTAPYDAALTEGLGAAGVDVRWATRPTRPGDRQELPLHRTDAFFYRRIEAMHRLPPALRSALKGFSHAAGLASLIRRVRRSRPDVVHIQWIVLPLLDVLALMLLRRLCPLVLTVHDTVPFNGQKLSWLQRLGHDLPIRLSSRVIVHTQSGRQALLRRGVPDAKIAVVPHGPLSLAEAPPPARGPRDPRWTFVLFGEIKPYKGLDLLVEAYARLPQSVRAQGRVIVAGRPRMDLEPLLARLTALGLQPHFELRLQRQSEAEMAALFAEADCFVFPYRQIDASGVYFLVSGLGKWLIASRVGIFAEDMSDGVDGALVPAEDVEALTQQLQFAIDRRPARATTAPSRSWADIGRATRAIYLEAMAPADPTRRRQDTPAVEVKSS